jgi:hypothetical protein
MVKIKYRQRISTIGKLSAQRNIKYNLENLKEGTNAKEYGNKVEKLLQILPNTEDQHVEAAWEDIKQICKAADNILGQKPRIVWSGWYDEECKEMLEEQNNARLKTLQRKTRSNIVVYKRPIGKQEKYVGRRKTGRITGEIYKK